ncbi:MAG TPA: DUF5711 family protein [Clostridiales bacterium]|nr:DUF5711 family protein [Clostridiales bacterium]
MGTNEKKSGVFLFILLLIAIMFTAYIAYLKSNNIDISKIGLKKLVSAAIQGHEIDADNANIFEIGYEAKDKPSFEVYREWLIKCTLYSVTAIDKKGEEQWSIPILLNKPMLQSQGGRLLVSDIGGRSIYVIEGKNIKWQKAVDGNIINASINETGYVSVVHETEGYKGMVSVYDVDGQEIFHRYINETFVLSSQVMASGQQIIINNIDASGSTAYTCIDFTDLMGNPFAALVPEQGAIYPFILALSDDSFALANDVSIIYYNKNREKLWENKYKKIYGCKEISDKSFIAAVDDINDTGGRQKFSGVIILNKDGRITARCPIDGQVCNISTFKDIAAVNNKREVYFINSKGTLEGKYSSITDIEKVIFFNKNEAALITKSRIIIINIK